MLAPSERTYSLSKSGWEGYRFPRMAMLHTDIILFARLVLPMIFMSGIFAIDMITLESKLVAEQLAGKLVKGAYKPIQRKCAIYVLLTVY